MGWADEGTMLVGTSLLMTSTWAAGAGVVGAWPCLEVQEVGE